MCIFHSQDMNEVSNFDTNRYSDKLNCNNNTWDDPPYVTSTRFEFFLNIIVIEITFFTNLKWLLGLVIRMGPILLDFRIKLSAWRPNLVMRMMNIFTTKFTTYTAICNP